MMASVRLLPLIALGLTLASTSALAYRPFFDNDPRTRHAPPPPEVNIFDLEVLSLCGDWGQHVKAREFEHMLLKPENRPVTERMRKALGSRVYGKARDTEEFVRQLRRAWFEQKGFAHVFCGEPGVGKDLGGLHYAARYWQAQDKGWAGYRRLSRNLRDRPLEKCRNKFLLERIKPPIYSIGVQFRNPKRPHNDVKCLSGYHRDMHAENILVAGTRALKQANKRLQKNDREACLYQTRLAQIPDHYNTAVIDRRALRTFYPLPEKKPYCRKNRKNFRACLCSKL